MRFAIDGQTFFSPDANRGIGAYLKSLVECLPIVGEAHEWMLLDWSPNHCIRQLLPEETLRHYKIVQMPPLSGDNDNRFRAANAAIRACVQKHHVDAMLNPNSLQIHVQPVSSMVDCGLALTVHDLTPIALGWKNYGMPNKELADYWQSRLTHIQQHADIVLTDSEATRIDVINHLNIPPQRVITALLGLDKALIPPANEAIIREGLRVFGLENDIDNYLLCVGGYNPKKNYERIIEAVGKQTVEQAKTCPMVFAGPLNQEDQRIIKQYTDKFCPHRRIVFTGFVSRETQAILYAGAICLLFPSLHEGFGLPALEAMACACPVIGSTGSSIPEVVGDCAIVVDPTDLDEITHAIKEICVDESLRIRLRHNGPKQAQSFTYEKTAQCTITGLEQAAARRDRRRMVFVNSTIGDRKPRLLWFSPLPPDPGGVALYSYELIRAIKDMADVTLATDAVQLPPELATLPRVTKAETQNDDVLRKFDLCVYNMMNNTGQAEYTYASLLRYPGLTILHDINIHGFLLDAYVRNKGKQLFAYEDVKPDPYTYALTISHGAAGTATAKQVLENGAVPDIPTFPCHGVIVRHSEGVIVHSPWAENELRNNAAPTPLFCMPLGMEALPVTTDAAKQILRDRYAIPHDAFLVVSGGYLEPSRRIDILIRALRILRDRGEKVFMLFAGNAPEQHGKWLRRVEKELLGADADSCIAFTGFLKDNSDFLACISTADAVAHLRYPTNGETSATVLRAMSLGKPLLVSDTDSYHDLPDDCCAKVPALDFEDRLIAEYISTLITRPDVRKAMGNNSYNFVRTVHAWSVVARRFMNIVAKILDLRRLQ